MTAQVEAAQAQMRVIYRSGSVGAAVAGVVWLASALTTVFAGVGWGIVVMVGVGFAIYPLTQAALRMLGGPASVPRDNPLRELAVEVPLVGPLMIPLVGAATLYRAEWFYPAFMLAMGGHYLPFSFLYGMRAFVVLGAVMSIGGLVIAVWASGLAVAGAFGTSVALFVFAAVAWREDLVERSSTDIRGNAGTDRRGVDGQRYRGDDHDGERPELAPRLGPGSAGLNDNRR
jgi:hypothetical protein